MDSGFWNMLELLRQASPLLTGRTWLESRAEGSGQEAAPRQDPPTV